jgi:hypothetical protein
MSNRASGVIGSGKAEKSERWGGRVEGELKMNGNLARASQIHATARFADASSARLRKRVINNNKKAKAGKTLYLRLVTIGFFKTEMV